MQNLESLTHVLSWQSSDVAYDLHSARDTDGNESVVINALGPGGRHRYAVVDADSGHGGDPAEWLECDEDARTRIAEAALEAQGGR
jgi:hypothetical protein